MEEATGSAHTPALRPLLAAIGTICVVGLASGLTLPLVSVRLAESGASTTLIAVMAAVPALGTMGISFALAALSRRLGTRTLLVAGVLLSCASVAILALPYAPTLWLVSRLALGVSAGILFALGEARVLESSTAAVRGRWTGLYASALTLCQFAGPALLASLGADSRRPIVVAVALHAVALLLVLGGLRSSDVAEAQEPLSARAFVRECLPLAAAALFFAMFDSTMLGLLPLYGLELGLGSAQALLMVSAVFLGDAILAIPLGWAADRLGRRRVHALCALLCAGAALALPFGLVGTRLLWPSLLLLGGAAGALYTLAIVRLGDRYRGTALVAANAVIGLLWGIGSLSGPLLGSLAMGLMRPHGLMLFVALGAVAVFATLLPRRTARNQPAAAGGDSL